MFPLLDCLWVDSRAHTSESAAKVGIEKLLGDIASGDAGKFFKKTLFAESRFLLLCAFHNGRCTVT
jgi:hypothetical protein